MSHRIKPSLDRTDEGGGAFDLHSKGGKLLRKCSLMVVSRMFTTLRKCVTQ